MIARALALFLSLASPAFAAPVAVTSGEHDGFTRIVLSFQSPIDWEFGRILDGYRFRPIGVQADYDLRAVFNRIGKSRLASISADPMNETLDIGFACACHAIPFEFRPGIIVIDLRDGPPPSGSSFEDELPAQIPADAPNLANVQRPSGPVYNWTDVIKPSAGPIMSPAAMQFAPQPSSSPDLQPLRDQLLRQLSRGASEGVINLSLPDTDIPRAPKAEVPAARVALGEMGGVQTQTVRASQPPLGAQGARCLPNENIAVHTWGGEDGTSALLNKDMTDLVGEFDTPQSDPITRAVQARLFLGFGQEARQLLQAFPDAADNEATLLSLSFLVDAESDPIGAFQGQGACDTAAAMWAALSDPSITVASQINTNAVTLAFAALPVHLRRHLGPSLVDRFLALEDISTATGLRNIMARGAGADRAGDLVDAKIDLAQGNPEKAEARLDSEAGGVNPSSIQAAIARVEARIAQGLAVDRETVVLLSAMEAEVSGSALGQELAVAKLHAQAASGDFASAFKGLAQLPAQSPTIWRLLASLANDSDFLTHAIPAPDDAIANLPAETGVQIAQRLFDLGMADPAAGWLTAVGQTRGTLFAQIALARKDARAALAALDEEETPLNAQLRASAFAILGDYQSAAQTLANVSQEGQLRALAQAKDWGALASGPRSAWKILAEDLNAPDGAPTGGVDTFGPLARGLNLAEQSANTRAAIDQLLAAFPADDR